MLTRNDYSYHVNDNIVVLRRADGLIIQRFTAMYYGSDAGDGTVATLPVSFSNNFYFAIVNDGADGCHTVAALPDTLSTVRMWGKVADIYVDTLVQIIAIGR